MDFLRRMYDILGECGEELPPWKQWRAFATENAELWPIEGGGKMIGGILFKGHTMHVAVLPEWRGRWVKPSQLRAWRQFQHPVNLYATPTNEESRELAVRLGFVECKPDDPGVGALVRMVRPDLKTYVKEKT
jgi:hypothetical protein